MNQKTIVKINWSIFGLLCVIGISTLIGTLVDLNTRVITDYEQLQSRVEFRWAPFHTVTTVILVAISVLLAIGWKRLFPFNIPIALILAGFYYFIFFLTFTIGWISLQGLLGLGIALIVSTIMLIVYSVKIIKDRTIHS